MSPSGSTFAKGWFPNPQGGRTTTAAFLRQRANRDAFEGKELLEPWVLPHLGEEGRVHEDPRVECMVLAAMNMHSKNRSTSPSAR